MQLPPLSSWHWQLFCRVIDNHGDLGVCWRLATQLAQRGQRVTLWVDDASALSWLAPAGANGVTVQPWPEVMAAADWPDQATVVIEAFGCELPSCAHERVGQHTAPLVWLNLEYLSAEAFVERNHGLASPVMHGPSAGRTKWFFYPGFTAGTGGLLADTASQASATLDQLGVGTGDTTEVVVFCYDNPALGALVHHFQTQGARVWCLPGKAADAAGAQGLTVPTLPYLSQPDFDALLHRSAFNVVRGEDSLTRALWAGQPFVWHIYPQSDGAHVEKLHAFLDRFNAPAMVRHTHAVWNALAPEALAQPGGVNWLPTLGTADWQQWCAWGAQARASLEPQADLVTQLQAWVHAHA